MLNNTPVFLRILSRTLLLTTAPLMAFLLYGFVVGLPLYLDDSPNFWFLDTARGLTYWGGSEAFRFYRPFVFTLWELSDVLAGGYDAVALHLLNLFTFIMTSSLIIALAMQCGRWLGWGINHRRLTGWMAGLIFVTFPFSYNTVPLISSAFHVVMVFGVVLALFASGRWAEYGHKGWFILAIASSFVATFSHENGFMTSGFLLAYFFLGRHIINWRRAVKVGLPVACVSGLYLILWVILPREQSPEGLLISYDVPRNLAFLLQGIAPFSASLVRIFIENPAPNVPTLILMVASGVAAVALLGKSSRWLGVGLIFVYGLAVLPSTLLLFPAYVLDSPRLMLLASVSTAFLWAFVFTRVMTTHHITIRLLALGFVIYAFTTTWVYHQARQNDFARLNTYHQSLLALAQQYHTTERPLLLINTANALLPLHADRTYLLGSEGVYFMVDELNYTQHFWANLDRVFHHANTYAYDQTLRVQGEFYNPAYPFVSLDELIPQFKTHGAIIATQFYPDGTFLPRYVGQMNVIEPGENALAQFTHQGKTAVILHEAQASYDTQYHEIQIMLDWQVISPAGVKAFVHVYCDDSFIAQLDGYPWADMYPFNHWQAQESQREYRHIRLSQADVKTASCLGVNVGIYDEINGTRYQALQMNGERYPNDSVRVEPVLR